jgi:peptidoglycan hydrolase CwlO-like protein
VVSSKAAEKKLADLWTESVEATADLKRLDDQIKQAKVEIGVAIVAGKAADNSKLTSLLEKRAEIELRLAELGKQINDAKAELKGAKG